MRIEQLEYVAAVTRFGSLRRASEHLHVSQPARQRGDRKLERELGVTLLDRRRSGARISARAADLLPYMDEVLEAVDRLRAAAGDQQRDRSHAPHRHRDAARRGVLVPAVQELRRTHPAAMRGGGERAAAARSSTRLAEGALDLGLVNLLAGDDLPQRFARVLLAAVPSPVSRRTTRSPRRSRHRRRPAGAVVRDDAARLPDAPLRHRLFGSRPPSDAFSADGAEMGKLMVAQGLGVTILPDYSLVDDPLCRAGLVTWRPIDDDTEVRLLLLVRDGAGRVLGDLQTMFATQAQRHTERAV